jgi:hypothetical protein
MPGWLHFAGRCLIRSFNTSARRRSDVIVIDSILAIIGLVVSNVKSHLFGLLT